MDPEELARLQFSTALALVGAAPLPGNEDLVRFPDRAFLAGHDPVPVLDENLSGRPVPEPPSPLVVVSGEELRQRAASARDIPYLRFGPPEEVDEGVRLSVELRLAGADPSGPALGLGGMTVTYGYADGSWRAVGDPLMFAM